MKNSFLTLALVCSLLFSACEKGELDPQSTGNYPDTLFVDYHIGAINTYEYCIYPYKVVMINMHSDSAVAYRWIDNSSSNPARAISLEGSYDIELTFGSGTKDTFDFYVLSCEPRVYVPNSFTPLYDGINDKWFPVCNYVESIHWEIRTEDGIKIFETDDVNGKWDGTLPNGDNARVGYYMYYINYSTLTETNIILTGHLQLYQ